MKTQYVVATVNKLYGRGWERYYKTEAEAVLVYTRLVNDSKFSSVRIRGERFAEPGGRIKILHVEVI